MAGTGIPMQITAVDSEHNLFSVQDVFSSELVEQVLTTPWLDVAWRNTSRGSLDQEEKYKIVRCPGSKNGMLLTKNYGPLLKLFYTPNYKVIKVLPGG